MERGAIFTYVQEESMVDISLCLDDKRLTRVVVGWQFEIWLKDQSSAQRHSRE